MSNELVFCLKTKGTRELWVILMKIGGLPHWWKIHLWFLHICQR